MRDTGSESAPPDPRGAGSPEASAPPDLAGLVDALRLRCQQAESALERARSRLRNLGQAIPLPVWIVGPDHQVRFQNQAHVDLFGRAPAGTTCHAFLWNGAIPCPGCNLARVLAGETLRDHRKLPDSDREFERLGVPIDAFGGRMKLEILVDATDRVQAQSLLRQAQRMESLGSLSAGIAHDFNNILAGVSGFAQLGERQATSSPGLQEPFRQIRNIADRGAELTRKILEFSRNQPMRLVPLDLNELVRSMQPLLAPMARDQVRIRLDLPEGLRTVMGDRGALEQAIFNLCSNAVDAMEWGGTLTLSTANVDADEVGRMHPDAPPMNGVVLRVTDTGCGMPPDVAQRIFEPFFTTKGPGRGTGLGLSVTSGIARQAGGFVTVDTRPGQGTTMSLVLPSTTVAPSRPAHLPPPPPAAQKRFHGRAVVVEDEPIVRDLVCRMLAGMGFDVVPTSCADEALPVVLSSAHAVDLVVSDIAMPGMNGCDLARRIHSQRPLTPVLLVTGCSRERLDQFGVSGTMPVLYKPFDVNEFAKQVETVVGAS